MKEGKTALDDEPKMNKSKEQYIELHKYTTRKIYENFEGKTNNSRETNVEKT